MELHLIINTEDLPLTDRDRSLRPAFRNEVAVEPSSSDGTARSRAPGERDAGSRGPATRPDSGAPDEPRGDARSRGPVRPGSLLDSEAMDAELSQLRASNKVRRKQLKQLRRAGALFGDVLARGFLTAYLLHLCNEHPRHGNDILNEIEDRTEGLWAPSSGGVYTLLRKLEKRELLEGSWEAGATRERRVYRITDEGRAALDEFRELAPPRIAAASRVLQLVGEDLLSRPSRGHRGDR